MNVNYVTKKKYMFKLGGAWKVGGGMGHGDVLMVHAGEKNPTSIWYYLLCARNGTHNDITSEKIPSAWANTIELASPLIETTKKPR